MVLRGAGDSESSPETWGDWGDLLAEDRGGWVSLPYAAGEGYKEVVQQLLDEGVAVDLTDNHGQSPLLRAAEGGHEAVVQLLKPLGA